MISTTSVGVPVPGRRVRCHRARVMPSSLLDQLGQQPRRLPAAGERGPGPGRRRAGQAAGRGEHHLPVQPRRPGSPSGATTPVTPARRSPAASPAGAGRVAFGTRHHAGQQPEPGLDHLGQRVLLRLALQQAEVEGHRLRPRILSGSGTGRLARSSAPGRTPVAASSTERRPSQVTVVSTAPTRFSPLAVGTDPGQHRGQRRLVQLQQHRRAGTRLRTSATCAATPSASDAIRSATAPGSASAGFWLRLSSIVAASVHGPQTWTLNGPVQSVGRLLQRVQVRGQQARPPGAGRGRAGPPASSRRRGLDRHVHQQRRGPAGQVGPDAAAGQLGQVRKVGQLAEDHRERLGRVGARHRADPGGAAGRPGKRRRIFVHEQSLANPADTRGSVIRSGSARSGPGPAAARQWSGHELRPRHAPVVARPQPLWRQVVVGPITGPSAFRTVRSTPLVVIQVALPRARHRDGARTGRSGTARPRHTVGSLAAQPRPAVFPPAGQAHQEDNPCDRPDGEDHTDR